MRKIKRILPIAQHNTNDRLLNSTMKPVNLKQLPTTLIGEMRRLRDSAAGYGLVSLAANQVSLERRMFVVLKSTMI